MEVVQIIPQEFVQNRTVEQIVVEIGAGETVQKTVEVIQLVPQERIQERIAEQFVDIPLPHIMEEIDGISADIPRTRQNRTVEQFVDVSIPQFQEETSPNQKYLTKSLCLAWLCG